MQFKQEFGQLSAAMEARLADVEVGAKREAQEQWLQEGRQLVKRQLSERLQPIRGQVTEAAEEARAARRAEAELGRRCERLQKACVELTAGQEVLTQHATSATKDLTWLQAEARARLQSDVLPAKGDRPCTDWTGTARSREGSRDRLTARLAAHYEDPLFAAEADMGLHGDDYPVKEDRLCASLAGTARSRDSLCAGGERLRCAWSGCLNTAVFTEASLGQLTARFAAHSEEPPASLKALPCETPGVGLGRWRRDTPPPQPQMRHRSSRCSGPASLGPSPCLARPSSAGANTPRSRQAATPPPASPALSSRSSWPGPPGHQPRSEREPCP